MVREAELVRDEQHRAALVGSARMTRSTSPTSSGSSDEVGSSNSITSGSIASARAIATRCCWPPESSRRIGVDLVGEPDLGELLGRASARRVLRHFPFTVRQPFHDVLQRRHVREQVELLEHHADALAHASTAPLSA